MTYIMYILYKAKYTPPHTYVYKSIRAHVWTYIHMHTHRNSHIYVCVYIYIRVMCLSTYLPTYQFILLCAYGGTLDISTCHRHVENAYGHTTHMSENNFVRVSSTI